MKSKILKFCIKKVFEFKLFKRKYVALYMYFKDKLLHLEKYFTLLYLFEIHTTLSLKPIYIYIVLI